MKITFLSPHIGISGGVKIIFEYANRLMGLGHDVTVVSTIPKSLRYNIKTFKIYYPSLSGAKAINPIDWFELKTKLILAEDFRKDYMPEGDAIIATAWQTAYQVNNYPDEKGKKFYFIQSYETWDGPEEEVDRTWTLPFHKIVIASWLKELAEKKFGQKVGEVLVNPIDFSVFYCAVKDWSQPLKVGMLYHKGKWKGVKDAKKAFLTAKKSYPDIELLMFGATPDPEWQDIEYKYHYRPSADILREIYCSCHIWLSASLVDGSALTPAEAMSCKCALVATDIGGVRDFAENGKTALLSPPGEPGKLAGNLIRLIEDEAKIKRIAEAGFKKISEFTWEKTVKLFEAELFKGVGS